MYLYRVLAGTFYQVRFGQDVGISNDGFRQFLLYNQFLVVNDSRCKETNNPGDFLPFSWGRTTTPFPIENSHLSPVPFCFSQLRKDFF